MHKDSFYKRAGNTYRADKEMTKSSTADGMTRGRSRERRSCDRWHSWDGKARFQPTEEILRELEIKNQESDGSGEERKNADSRKKFHVST